MRADDLSRRQRSKNLVVAVLLVTMGAAFFTLTIVRMGQQSPLKPAGCGRHAPAVTRLARLSV